MPEQDRDLDLDTALTRLEDVLLALPQDRAVPDLEAVLRAASVPRELLHRDERAWKVLHEAIIARPFGDLDTVGRVRTEVELLTLEVEVLHERLAEASTSNAEVDRAAARLREVRRRLDQLRSEL